MPSSVTQSIATARAAGVSGQTLLYGDTIDGSVKPRAWVPTLNNVLRGFKTLRVAVS